MGLEYEAKCSDCGHCFIVREEGGFFFDLLHCDQCGKEKEISHEKHKELACKRDGSKAYQSAVEKIAGKCRCRGQFSMDAPARCKKCKSAKHAATGPMCMYD